jgi:hypothetical protein
MPDNLQQIVERMVKAGESEGNIALVIKHYKAQPPVSAGDAGMTGAVVKDTSTGRTTWVEGATDTTRKVAATAAPTVGGIVGGLVGGNVGAAVGGAAGVGYKQLLEHATEIPGAVVDVARNLVKEPKATLTGFVQGATEGAKEAGLEAASQGAANWVGGKVAQAGGVMAKWLMNRATTRVSARLMRDFPELSDTLIDNALTVSKGGEAKARSLLVKAKLEATKALKLADEAGATIPVEMTEDLATSLKTALVEKAIKTGGAPAQSGQALSAASQRLDPATKQLFARVDQAASKGTPLDLSPTQADLLKTQLQKESRALYANRTAPNGQKAMGMDATERAEFASRLNDAIDVAAKGYKAANAKAKPLIGAVRGIGQAIRPNGNLYQAMVRPAVGAIVGEEAGRRSGVNPIAAGVAGAAMTSPAGMSREAILLAHPAVQTLLRQLPKPLADALTQFAFEQQAQRPQQSRNR